MFFAVYMFEDKEKKIFTIIPVVRKHNLEYYKYNYILKTMLDTLSLRTIFSYMSDFQKG